MYVKGKNRGGHTYLPPHPKKHHKPYRIRHVGLFFTGVATVILSAFAAGYLLGRSYIQSEVQPTITKPAVKSIFGQVKSSFGYSFQYDNSAFSASAATSSGQTVPTGDLKKDLDISDVNLMPKSSAVNGSAALSSFKLHMDSSSSGFKIFKSQNAYGDDRTAVTGYFAPVSDQNFTVSKLSRSSETVGSLKFYRTVYEQKPNFSSSKPIFLVVWTSLYHGRPVSISIRNLLNSGQIPDIYGPVLESLRFGSTNKGVLSDTTDSRGFDINKISPAVVKIYHFVCGTLVINGVSYGHDACGGGTGSGFFVSGDGYIATSGHVVVLNAADILVSQLLSNPALLRQFTSAAGLTPQQSSRSDVVASLLAKLYDLPPAKLRLDNRREITFAALGDHPLADASQAEVKKDFKLLDSDYIKKADVVAVDYQPKDLLVIEQNTQQGFSASDIALLKVNSTNSPFITMADSSSIEQDAAINLIGFPADADNQLTDNQTITPSVTTGIISSIRQANGSSSLLFQTDADASEGNSGGPAVNQAGQAFGLVTYRFKSDNQADAAKSYLRDIADLKGLINTQNISLDLKSPTQSDWEAGLDLFVRQRYSKALVQFRQVQKLYPAQRLVGSYIAQAEQAISDGKDKKDAPFSLMILLITGIGGGVAIVVATRLIISHRRAHLAYKAANLNSNGLVHPTL